MPFFRAQIVLKFCNVVRHKGLECTCNLLCIRMSQVLFRPITVMVPDLVLICENMLMAEGFVQAKTLASKFYGLYSLLQELLSKQVRLERSRTRTLLSAQRPRCLACAVCRCVSKCTTKTRYLSSTRWITRSSATMLTTFLPSFLPSLLPSFIPSFLPFFLSFLCVRQDHYDWGMRAVKSVLVVAGMLKRAEPSLPEDSLLMRALRDFNTPKIVHSDEVRRLVRLLTVCRPDV